MQLLKERKQHLDNPKMQWDKEVLEHSINNLKLNSMEMFADMEICAISTNTIARTVLTQATIAMYMQTIKIVRIEVMILILKTQIE
jgi:hypothetical protein